MKHDTKTPPIGHGLTIGVILLLLVAGLLFFNQGPSTLFSPFTNKNQSFSFQNKIWHGGFWKAEGTQSLENKKLMVDVSLSISDKLVEQFAPDKDDISALLVVERLFDKDGIPTAMNNEYYSTVLTPGGMPIEFSQSAFGSPSQYNLQSGLIYATPIDKLQAVSIGSIRQKTDLSPARFTFKEDISNLPDGLYRPLLYFFYNKENTPESTRANRENTLSLAHQILYPMDNKFIERQSPWSGVSDYAVARDTLHYLPVFTAGTPKQPKIPFVLFADKISQGSKGIVSEEDSKHFQLSTREVTQTKLILDPGTYSLDPTLPLTASFDQKLQLFNERIPLAKKGYIEGEMKLPSGKTEKIEKREFTDFKTIGEGDLQTGQKIAWRALTAPNNKIQLQETGQYTLTLQGKVYDTYGNVYDGGGTYTFYVGKKLTFSSAVKPGTPFYVGDAYIPRFSYYPPLLGKAKLIYTFYPFDTNIPIETKTIEKENLDGTFNDTPLPFKTAGEYHVTVIAEAHNIFMGDFYGSYDSGSIVVPKESDIVLHGKMGGKFADGTVVTTPRFTAPRYPLLEPRRELYFPYNQGDILYIAANKQNSISPQVTLTDKNNAIIPIAPTGKQNLHPFLFPESRESNAYVFITSEKAGMIARTFVGTEFLEHTFWNVRGNDFGGRLNASKAGDAENDVYRNFAAVVLQTDNISKSASYISNISVTSETTDNDRVVEPFTEPFVVTGEKPHLFVIGTGLQKPVGGVFNQYVHVFPAVKNTEIKLSVTKPDGTKKIFPPVVTDGGGFTPAGDSFKTELPGVYFVNVQATYKGKTDKDFYKVYVAGKDATPLSLGIPPMSTLPTEGVTLIGKFPAGATNVEVDYEILMPGAIMDANELSICPYSRTKNSFSYTFAPQKLNSIYKNFEINPLTRMVFMYFHVTGMVNGKVFQQFAAVMVRGNKMYYLGIPPPPNV